jgi:hypothetical protein
MTPVDVYVDVSSSCAAWIPSLYAAVLSCRGLVAPRVLLFSTEVKQIPLAALARGEVETSGGTLGACVTEHLGRTKSRAAVMLTDGYVGPIPQAHHAACRRARLQVVLTPGGWKGDLAEVAAAVHHLEAP